MSFLYPIAAFTLAAAGLVAARRCQRAECHSSPVLAAIGAGLLGGVAGGLLAAGCVAAAHTRAEPTDIFSLDEQSLNKLGNDLADILS